MRLVTVSLRHVVLVGLVAVALLAPSTASAEAPQPLSPPDGYTMVAGSPPPTFTVSPGSGATNYLWVHVSANPQPDFTGILGMDVTLGELFSSPDGVSASWTPQSYSFPGYWLVTPGTYYWQPYRISYADDPDGAEEGAIRRLVVAPAVAAPTPQPQPQPPLASPAPPVDPEAGLSRELIPRRIGFRNSNWDFYVSTGARPASIPAARWRAVASTTGRRWGMKYRGSRPGTPYVGDGESDVGFGRRPYGVLGSEIDLVRNVYRRYRHPRRVCSAGARGVAHATRCRYVRRKLVRRYYLDSDIILSRAIDWQPGPATPGPDQYDLETVLLHEMGHMAGNLKHVRRCRVSPMVEALDLGEWWRSTTDWNFNDCGLPPGTARIARASATFTHQTIRRSLTLPPGRSGVAQLRALDAAHARR